ncbi:MAG: SpoIIE family protein phosphatase [Bryobacterales bacterium]|nr:SpoIIE family protein phosphatase [Bryobacterales bacterium]
MAHHMDMRDRERMLRVAAGLLLVVLGSYQFVATGMFFENMRWPENVVQTGFTLTTPWPAIGNAGARAKEAGLQSGDRLLEVQGARFHGEATIHEAMEKLFPGDRMRLLVEGRDGARREVSWQLEALNGGKTTIGRTLFLSVMSIGMPFLCLLTGFWTVMARPRNGKAWLLLGMLATFAHSVVHPGPFASSLGLAGRFFQMQHVAMNGAWGLFMFLFAWEFPRKTAWQERTGWIPRLIGATLGLVVAGIAAREAMTMWGEPGAWGPWVDRVSTWLRPAQLLQMLAIGGFFALLSYKRNVLDDLDSQRRLRLILAGATVGLTPLFLLLIWALIRQQRPDELWIVPAILAMFLFPVTLGYVIVVQRAFGFGGALRQGLQYALARRGVRVLQSGLILGVILTAVLLASQPGMNRPRILQVVAVGTALVFALQRGAELLSGWVDRRFFREAYNAELVLANLSEDVRTMVETRPLLEAVATRVGEALHVDRIALLLREGGQFQPAYAIGYGDGGSAALPETARTAEVLRRERTPLRVYLDDSNSWIYREGLNDEETAWLRTTAAELLLPLAVKDKLLGFISMGRKRSEEPYSGNDVRLLQSVATQTGLALENSQLAAAMTEAVAQRERLNREVEIAQEVQERLFPQNLPAIAELDYWGYCRPAKGVGGDSYDFLALESGLFAISIGDVSGKGIPASLLMASLQSALRGQAMSNPGDLGVMIGTLNRLIFDSSPSNRYATLFYSQWDPATRILTYVNGGHCPPMVLRGREILRLEEGGPVVGLFRPARFTQGTFQVERGDVLVGFTDGISEAMDARDEEWGEEALGEFLRSCAGDTAQEMIPKIVAGADAFANGHPQHDDMTLIVVRFL